MAGHILVWQCAWIQDPQRTQWHVPNKDQKRAAMDSKVGSALDSLRYDLVEPIPCLPGILPPPSKFPTPLYQSLGSSSCRTRETAESGTLGYLYGQLLIAFDRQRLNHPDGSGECHTKVLCPMQVVAANERNGREIAFAAKITPNSRSPGSRDWQMHCLLNFPIRPLFIGSNVSHDPRYLSYKCVFCSSHY